MKEICLIFPSAPTSPLATTCASRCTMSRESSLHWRQFFYQLQINIDSVFQKPGYSKSKLPFVITLEPCPASLVEQALTEIASLKFHVQPCLNLPILD